MIHCKLQHSSGEWRVFRKFCIFGRNPEDMWSGMPRCVVKYTAMRYRARRFPPLRKAYSVKAERAGLNRNSRKASHEIWEFVFKQVVFQIHNQDSLPGLIDAEPTNWPVQFKSCYRFTIPTQAVNLVLAFIPF